MARRQIRTSIRNQGAALLALGFVTVVCLSVLAAVVALGDQRRISVVLTNPDDGGLAPGTLRSIAITFSEEPRTAAVEAAFSIEPPILGAPRWRGKTLEYLLREPLAAGNYTVRIESGALGRAAEKLAEPYQFGFTVREPSLLLITHEDGGERLVEVRDGTAVRRLAEATRVWDFAVSPDGSSVAVVTGEREGGTRLALVDTVSGQAADLVDTPSVDISKVSWSPDSLALLVVRREVTPEGTRGVPRAWLMRLTGEFVTPIDVDGEPSLSPTWSPDGQSIAYVAPATGRLRVFSLATQEVLNAGQPRSGAVVWSPDSSMLAYEGVPAKQLVSNPAQPLRVVALDGSVDVSLGEAGETRSQPQFLDNSTVMSLRRQVGGGTRGTELVFESLPEGAQLRTLQLTAGSEIVLSWDLDPTGRSVVYTVQVGTTLTTLTMDLESGRRDVVRPAGVAPTWLP